MFCNELFSFNSKARRTIPLCKRKVERFSIRYRGAVLCNKLYSIGIIPLNIGNASKPQITQFFHNHKFYLMLLAVGKASFL